MPIHKNCYRNHGDNEQINELINRVKALKDFAISDRLPVMESGTERSISQVIVDMENYVRTLVVDPPVKTLEFRLSRTQNLVPRLTKN